MSINSNSTGGALPAGQVSINDSRRIYNFGERVAELAPQTSPFFVYLSKIAKEATDDPVFKFLEQRHQFQRRNFILKGDQSAVTGDITNAQLVCGYDKYGSEIDETATGKTAAPQFLINGQVVRIQGKAFKVSGVNTGSGVASTFATGDTAGSAASYTEVDLTALETIAAGDLKDDSNAANRNLGQVIGSAWAEGSTDPDGWKDELSTREGYCQIFKTGIELFSGSALATRYRGRPDEYKRVWADKLMEHKMDIEHAMLFGVGASDETTDGPVRYTHGIVPYTEANGNVYDFTYASSNYDEFIDAMQDFFAPESGNSGDKLVLASRKIMAWLSKLGSDGFLNNTVTSNSYKLDVQNIQGAFGHQVTKVNTLFGNLHFVPEPLFRNQDDNLAIAVDLANVKYRPLVGNGVSRDTHIISNVQNNNVDGRKDIVMTEAGLEISLPETHAVMKWS